MNRLLSWIGALFLIGGVGAASDPDMSSYISTLSLPDGVKMRIGRGGVYSVDYSPNGERIAVAGTIGVWIYDARYGKEIALLRGHTNAVNSADYSPDGKKIVSSSWDGSVRMWDTDTGELLNTLRQNRGGTYSAEFSPDGKSFLAATGKSVMIWDAESNRRGGKLLKTLTGHTDIVFTAAYSPDGKTAAGGGRFGDPTVKIWDVETGALLNSLEADKDKEGIISIAFSPDGKRIVSANLNNTDIRIWDVQSGALLHTLESRGSSRMFAYSTDRRLLAGSLGSVWSADYASPLQPFSKDNSGSAVSFSPDGHNVAGDVGGGVRIVNIQIRSPVYTFGGHISGMFCFPAFSPDGKTIAARGGADSVNIWDYEAGAHLKTLGKREYPKWAAYTPDGKTIAYSNYEDIVIRNVETDALLLKLKGHTASVLFGSYSSNGERLVSASRDKTVRVWDAAAGALLITLAGHTERVNCAAFSPDGKTIASASDDGTIRIWNAETGALFKTLEGHTEEVNSAAYSPDGKTIASASDDGTIRIWNAETGALFKTLKGHRWMVNSAAYSPDGKTIASGGVDEMVRIWDAAAGTLLKKLEGHTGNVEWVGYSPDGKTLGSASEDGTVLIWDVSDLSGSGGDAPEEGAR